MPMPKSSTMILQNQKLCQTKFKSIVLISFFMCISIGALARCHLPLDIYQLNNVFSVQCSSNWSHNKTLLMSVKYFETNESTFHLIQFVGCLSQIESLLFYQIVKFTRSTIIQWNYVCCMCETFWLLNLRFCVISFYDS